MGQRESLNAYLKSVKDKPFEWGKHDCLTFTNNAYRQMYGIGWADDWLGKYMKDAQLLRRKDLEKEFGFKVATARKD